MKQLMGRFGATVEGTLVFCMTVMIVDPSRSMLGGMVDHQLL